MAAKDRPLLALGVVLALAAVGLLWATRGPDLSGLAKPADALVLGLEQDAEANLAEIDGAGLAGRGPRAGQRSGVIDQEAATQLPSLSLSGVVLDGLRGTPVEGALVMLADTQGETHVSTDAEGRFSLNWSRPNPGLRVEHPEYVDLRKPQVDFGQELEVLLVPSGSVQGRLISLGNALPEGVNVHLWPEVRGRRSAEPDYSVKIDGQFRYRLMDVTPGTYAVGIAEPGLPVVVRAGIMVSPGNPTFEDLELPRGSTVKGQVIEGVSRRPMGNVRVRFQAEVQGLSNSTELLAAVETTTAEDGTFNMQGVPTGQVEVWTRTAWGHRQKNKVNTVEGQEAKPLLVVVAAPATLAGKVLDTQGLGLAGALVVRCLEDEMSSFSWGLRTDLELSDERLFSVITDSGGGFDFGKVPGRQKQFLRAYGPLDSGAVIEPVAASQRLSLKPGEDKRDLLLQLSTGFPVSGRVLDGTGLPLTGVDVSPRSWVGRGLTQMPSMLTDADGYFHFAGLAEGPLHLVYECDGFLDMRKNYTVSEEMADVEESMTPTSRLSGVIVDSAGYAIPSGVAVARFDERKSRTKQFAIADEWGRFEFDGLYEGTWYVVPVAPGWEYPEDAAPAQLLPGATPLHLIMTPRPPPAPASVTGELRLAGTGEPIAGLRFNDLRRGAVKISGTRFSIQGMRPGRLSLLAFGDGVESYTYPRITLEPGAMLDLGSAELRRTTSVTVTVLGPDGLPRRKGEVFLQRLPENEGGRPTGSKQIKLRFDPRKDAYVHERVPRYRWELVIKVPGLDKHRQEIGVKGSKQKLEVRVSKKAKGKGKR
ncbi:MAG: protocatechuate 3,4-dioxygenase beta subunit [Planctomycetota bacterium]|jgi:protocatechuate 3,4-dioxygenase beta subunit